MAAIVPSVPVIVRRRVGFVRNWVARGDADSRSLRRRLLAVLRSAHRILGAKRDRLGLGSLGVGGAAGALLAVVGVMTTPQAAFCATCHW